MKASSKQRVTKSLAALRKKKKKKEEFQKDAIASPAMRLPASLHAAFRAEASKEVAMERYNRICMLLYDNIQSLFTVNTSAAVSRTITLMVHDWRLLRRGLVALG